ncbi:MAG: negative regulator of septation ring formation, partial [Xanthobacteraceae bacterium]
RTRVQEAEHALITLVNGTTESLQTGARLARDTLSTVSGEVGASLRSAAADAEHVLSATGASTVSAILGGIHDAQTTLLATSDQAAVRARDLSAEIARTLGSASTSAADAMLSSAREAQSTLLASSEQALSRARDLSADIAHTLGGASMSTAENVLSSAREAQSALVAASEQALARARDLSAEIERTLGSASSASAETVLSSAREAHSTLLKVASDTAAQAKILSTDIEKTVTTAGANTADAVLTSAREAHNTLLKVASDTAVQARNLSADVERTLTGAGASAAALVANSVQGVQTTLLTASTEAATQIKTITGDIERTISTAGSNTADALLSSARDAQNALLATAGETAKHLKTVSGDLERTVNAATTNATEALQQSARNAQHAIVAASNEASASLAAASSSASASIVGASTDVNSALIAASNEASTKVKSTSSEIERAIMTVTGQFGTVLVGKTEEIVSGVKQQADRLTQIIDASRGTLVQALSDRSNQMNIDIRRATDEALKSIEAKGSTFSQSLVKNSTDLARSITTAGEIATGAVNKSLKDIEQTTRVAIDQSRQVATAAVTEMQETSKILRTDTVALFERLREGNILLQEVLTGAHENLNSLEHALVTRVSEFVATMNDVMSRNGVATGELEDQLGIFTSKTSSALQHLGELSSQFASHGEALVSAAALIERSNKATNQTVAERKADLEGLVTTIDLRTTDLDQRLTRFTGLLDDSLAAAETRARDIARVVAETAGAGATAITRQFEAVRSLTEDERRHTEQVMTELYSQNTEQVETLFRQSAERFAAVVQNMKQMAAEMHQELEATRAELRRGVLEIPQETADNTAQMRKVIVDQIEALAELNRIVARHGRGLDVSSANAGRSYQRDEEPMLATAGGRSEAAPRPAMRRDSGSASTLPPPDLGAPAAPRRTEAPSVSPGADQSGDGWLSNLLNRADTGGEAPRGSRPAPQPARAGAGSPLDSLAGDIARLLDRDLAAEMWDRYQRGERKAFTKRLYTPAGQKAFDEVSRKYRTERNFKQTVDRYITEFERLLDDVARDERGPAALRSYLTSETGLVYTLLAHAAGRLG